VSTPLDRLTAALADRFLREIEITARLQPIALPGAHRAAAWARSIGLREVDWTYRIPYIFL
jgi:hypothetical protein